ncbi:MAG: serine/threonine protein kinase [Fimbriiglobus sp.]
MTETVTAPKTTSIIDPAALLQELVDARILTIEHAESILGNFRSAGLGVDAAALAEFLAQAGLLTTYQADQTLAGKASKLILGPYLLAEPVGSGSLGMVYRAVHVESRDRFAVKQLPLRSLWNVIQAKKQVQIFANLAAHPAIVPFVDIDTAGGCHYLVWPYMEGETFEQLVKRSGPLPPAHVVRFVSEICSGLKVAHQAGIAHGLLKPSNILLGPDRKAHILDFGIGAILSENIADDESLMDTISTANVAMSMIDCTPPETFANPTTRTPAGDTYSLGCIMYYLLTASYPFPDGNVVDKMIAHQMHEPVPASTRNANVPETMSEIIGALMQKNPNDRPYDLDVLAQALKDALPTTHSYVMRDLPAPRLQSDQSVALGWEQRSNSSSYSNPATSPPGMMGESLEAISFNMGGDTPLPEPSRVSQKPLDETEVDYFAGKKPETPKPASGLQPVSMPDFPIQQIVLQSKMVNNSKPVAKRPAEVKSPQVELPPTSVNWAKVSGEAHEDLTLSPVVIPKRPAQLQPSFIQKILRRFFPSRHSADVVQFSLFGPSRLVPGQKYTFQAYSHPPESFNSVRTISRAFAPDTELLGSNFSSRLISRGSEIGLHLALANSGVARSLLNFRWVGQAKPWSFEVFVPWEAPSGITPGMLSMGLNMVEIGNIPFEVIITSRTG